MKLKKLFICLILSLIMISSCTFATEDPNLMTTLTAPKLTTSEDSLATSTPAQTINEDLYIYNTDSYSIDNIINGNVFASTSKLVINPRNKGGVITGDVFAIASEFDIQSDITYSNSRDKNDNYIISNVNSKSIINGNVYAFSEDFTLESGSEIHGNLYVYSNSVNIMQDAIIDGNVYIRANSVIFNGQLTGSAYVSADDFSMDYFAYIARDLYLNGDNAFLAGVIFRNAFITENKDVNTTSDFIVYKNLNVNYAENFTFSGEVQENAVINAKNLNFKNSDEASSLRCIIKGNLDYGCTNEVSIPDGVVSGEVSSTDFVGKVSTAPKSFVFGLISFIFYILVIVFFAKLVVPNCLEKLPKITTGNVFAGFGIGVAASFATFILVSLFIILWAFGFSIIPGFVVLLVYLLALALALPLLILNIANLLKFKLNVYLKVLIIAVVLYLINLIPVVGSIVMLFAVLTGTGMILLPVFNRKK